MSLRTTKVSVDSGVEVGCSGQTVQFVSNRLFNLHGSVQLLIVHYYMENRNL